MSKPLSTKGGLQLADGAGVAAAVFTPARVAEHLAGEAGLGVGAARQQAASSAGPSKGALVSAFRSSRPTTWPLASTGTPCSSAR